MRKFASWATIAVDVQKALDKIADADKSKAWDGRRKAVIAFKNAVHAHGMDIQGKRCAWCTLAIGPEGRRTAHRDHIAPKALYAQWTFTAQNLILACEFCNGFSVKADLDTVRTVGTTYDKSEFLIVHPYLDEPANHIEFSDNDGNGGVLAVGKTDLGLWTIRELQLDSPGLTKERSKDYIYFLHTKQALPPYYLDLYNRATGRKAEP